MTEVVMAGTGLRYILDGCQVVGRFSYIEFFFFSSPGLYGLEQGQTGRTLRYSWELVWSHASVDSCTLVRCKEGGVCAALATLLSRCWTRMGLLQPGRV